MTDPADMSPDALRAEVARLEALVDEFTRAREASHVELIMANATVGQLNVGLQDRALTAEAKSEELTVALTAIWAYCHQAAKRTDNADLAAIAKTLKDKAPTLFGSA